MTRLTLRLQRVGTAAFGALTIFVLGLNSAGYGQVAGTSAASREAFAEQVSVLGRQVSYLLPLPVRVDTLGGYVEWRAFGGLVILVAFWGVLAGSALRVDEERGLVEGWLAAGVSRARLLAARTGAFALASTAVLALAALATWAGAIAGHDSLSLGAVLAQCAALELVTLVWFEVGLLAAQLVTTRRSAAGLASAAMLLFFFVNSLGRTETAVDPFRRLSPFYLYDRTQALIPQGAFDVTANLMLAGACLALLGLSALAFVRRDVGSVLIPRPAGSRGRPLVGWRRLLLRGPALESLYERRLGLLAWATGLAAFTAVVVQSAPPAAEALRRIPAFRYLAPGQDPVAGYVGAAAFEDAAILLVAYAVTWVAMWAGEDAGGRLELLLSTPISRERVVAERALAALLGTALLALVTLAALLGAAALERITLDIPKTVLATLGLLPLALAFAALGALAAARAPRLAVGAASGLAVISYLLVFLGPLFKLPDWILNVSAFRLYGSNPLLGGVSPGGEAILVAVTLAGFGGAAAALAGRDAGS